MSWRVSRQWMWTVASVVVVLGAWTARAFHHPPTLQVTTAPITTGPIVRAIVATGTLQAVTTVQVGAQVSGTIESLGADFNSIVHAGQVIAKLDPALFAAALAESQARLGEAEASLRSAQAAQGTQKAAVADAQTKLTRAEELARRQLIAQSDLDAARIAAGEAQADLKSGEASIVQADAAVAEARAAVDQAKVNLDHTVITSPIEGIVVSRNVDIGQTVASAVQAPVLFSIAADLTQMQVEVDIDESDIGGVEAGEPATFQVESYPNETFQGRVSMVRLQPVAQQTTSATAVGGAPGGGGSTSVATVVSYATMITVSNPDEKLRPGMTATVNLAGTRIDDATRIPNAALSFRPSPEAFAAAGESADDLPAAPASDATKRQVWKYEGSRFVPVDVQVNLADRQWTSLVRGSLHPGDAVVTGAIIDKK